MMFDWLINWFLNVVDPFTLAGKVQSAIVRVVNVFIAVFVGWYTAGVKFGTSVIGLAGRIRNAMVAFANWAEYIVTVAFPRWATDAFRKAAQYVGQEVGKLTALVRGWVDDAIAGARQELGVLARWATGWVATIRADVGALWNRFRTVEQRVLGLLTDPRPLADWLAEKMAEALGRYAMRQLRFWGGFALRHAIPLTRTAAGWIERIIVDAFG